MFNFKRKTTGNTETSTQPVDNTAELRARLDSIEQQLVALGYQNADIVRTIKRIETKLTKLGIAAGYPDAVSRNATTN